MCNSDKRALFQSLPLSIIKDALKKKKYKGLHYESEILLLDRCGHTFL